MLVLLLAASLAGAFEPPTTSRLSDAEALGAVLAVSEAASSAAAIAKTRAWGAAARGYAARSADWHADLKKEAARLSKKSGVSAEKSTASEALRRRGEKALETLKSAKDFDAAYIETQEKLHRLADQLLERNAVRGEDYYITQLLAKARGVIWKLSDPRQSFAAEYPLLHRADGDD
ncbi:MAG: DUF4142 domain-containing protein [Elusimicrobia bacterium]|nr:DUF4142 domain-containing protein [Elusimicrobiota bacterium]